ncbi:hypothetical protein JCM8097_002864 [Rhodosporidiobolus ruineniae]
MPKQPKQKGKLAKALSGQQAAAAQRAAAERAAQADKDRADAQKAKMSSGRMGKNKRRKVGEGKTATAGEGDVDDDAEDEKTAEERQEERRKKGTQPFRRGERVLLVGEGNFSFSHSLLLPTSVASASSSGSSPPQPLITPSLLLCTAYDSEKVAREKYPDLDAHVSALRSAGATVLFGVDATKLEENKEVREFAKLGKVKNRPAGKKGKEVAGVYEGEGGYDKIVFNFPHVGQGITDQARNVRTNQSLLLDFYRSSALLLRRGTPRAPGSTTRDVTASQSRSARDVSRSPSPAFLLEDEETEDPAVQLLPPPPSTRGSVLLTLRTTAPYSLWLPAQLATKGHLLVPSLLSIPEQKARLAAHNGAEQPTFKTVRSWGFEPTDWEGYEHRRTIGWDEKRSSERNDDIRLTAKERNAKRFSNSGAGGGGGGGGGKDGAKGKEPLMRTWEFELVHFEDEWRHPSASAAGGRGGAGGKAGGGKKRGRAGGADDPDLSDS